MAVRFEVAAALQGVARRTGSLCLPHASAAIRTPALVCSTSRGAVPYVLPDHFDDFHPSVFSVTVGDMVDCELAPFRAHPDGACGVFHLPGPVLLMHRVAPIASFVPLMDGHPVADTVKGRRALTASLLGTVAGALRPAAMVCPADQVAYGSGKRARAAVQRTATLFRTYADALPAGSAVFAPVAGATPELARESARLMVQAAEAVQATADRHVQVIGVAVLAHGGESPAERLAMYRAVWDTVPAHWARLVYAQSVHDAAAALSAGADLVCQSFTTEMTERGEALLPGWHVVSLYDPQLAENTGPLLPGCGCYACRRHSVAYMHHLLMTHEMLGSSLLATHNLTVLQSILSEPPGFDPPQ